MNKIEMISNSPMMPSIRIVNSMANTNKQLWTTNLLEIQMKLAININSTCDEYMLIKNEKCVYQFFLYLGLNCCSNACKSILIGFLCNFVDYFNVLFSL